MYEEGSDSETLFQVLTNDWHIFSNHLESTRELIDAFCSTIFGSDEKNHNTKVHLPVEYLENYGVFSGHTWDEFSLLIKEKNRFCNSYFRADQFISFLSYSVRKYSRGTILYRARIWDTDQGYDICEMGSPPPGKRRSGRVNPEGISVLYLTTDEKTALNEVRATAFDYVSVGNFRLKKDINVINIAGLNDISPVLYTSGLESLAANTKIFGDIAREIAKPLRRNDSPLEYLPTQYITEFIKSKGYSGVEYTSAMGTGGTNLAVFDESLLECIDVHNVEIHKIDYQYDDISPKAMA